MGSKTATPDLLTTSDLPETCANGIGLTLGCHMGLNLADTFVANPNPAEQAACSTGARPSSTTRAS